MTTFEKKKINGLWVVSTESPSTFSRFWDENRAEKSVLFPPTFCHVANCDHVHLTLLEKLKHLTGELIHNDKK